jgi:undecaprenyl-phosphate galactose phosphotransferase
LTLPFVSPVTTSLGQDRAVPGIGPGRHAAAICGLALLAADGAALLVAALLGGVSPDAGIAAAAVAMLSYLAAKGRYHQRMSFWSQAQLAVSASLCAIAIIALSGVWAGHVPVSQAAIVAMLIFAPLAIAANRLATHALGSAGLWTLKVVIVGTGAAAAQAEAALASAPSLGYRIVGRIDPKALMSGAVELRLALLLQRYGASLLLIALDSGGELQRRVIACALRERVAFVLVPPPTLPTLNWVPTRMFGHQTLLLSFRGGCSRPAAQLVKACIDIPVAAAMLLFLSPLLLVIAAASCLDGGPILFAHRRVGAGGRPFACLKFRTMRIDGDRILDTALASSPALAAEWAATRKLADDPRVTRVGRFLRRTSLDELPQLLNVLRLEMSLVGPRPIVEGEVAFYGENIALYYATRPGITGLWQVSGRSNTTYARRVELDVWYVNNWTVWHDITLLLKTIPAVLGRQGAC